MLEWLKSFLKAAGIFFSLLVVGAIAVYVSLTIMIPQEQIEVPKVVGSSVKEALLLLSEKELSVKVVGEKFSEKIPADIIISQTPPPGTKVKKNRIIEVVVSEGAQMVNVPSLEGLKLREAKLQLSQRGIRLAHVSSIHYPLNQDEVIAQNPPEDFDVGREEGVSLLVSNGPRNLTLMMPDFRDKRIDTISELMQDIPLEVAKIKETPSQKEEGVILSQSPPPGTRVDEGTGIELVVSGTQEKTTSSNSRHNWRLTQIEIPLGFDKEKVYLVVRDEEGEKTFDYGTYPPGEKVWLSYEVVGKGEVRIYIGNKLVKVERVK